MIKKVAFILFLLFYIAVPLRAEQMLVVGEVFTESW